MKGEMASMYRLQLLRAYFRQIWISSLILFISIGVGVLILVLLGIVNVESVQALASNPFFAIFYVFTGSVSVGGLVKWFSWGFIFVILAPTGLLFVFPFLLSTVGGLINALGWFSILVIVPGVLVGYFGYGD
jgi:hypothetical protein